MPTNPTDIARIGHRYQVVVKHTGSNKELVASRIQRFEPAIQTNLDVYNELGSVDPTGFASDAPTFRVTVEENVHASDLDLLLAGKDPAVDTSWNLGNYINDSKLTAYLLERDNSGAIAGELEFSSCIVSDATWTWRIGQAISAQYTLLGRVGKRYKAANVVHNSWGAQDTSSPGGIKPKDARLFLGSTATGSRVYRLQGFTLRVTWPNLPVPEIGNRALAGFVQQPPSSSLDLEFAAADHQPDDLLFALSSTYYDYNNPSALSASAIRVYDPTAAEGSTVLRAWALENLVAGNSSPVLAQVRGLATKRYNLVIPKATTAGSGGILMFNGDLS